MKLLLDTHTFIWWDSEPEKLSITARQLCEDSSNTIMLSVTSAWEMQIKYQLGKLKLNIPLQEIIKSQEEKNQIQILPIQLRHIFAISSLPNIHRDPFDRLLIAQTKIENLTLLSCDKVFSQYPIEVIW